MTELEERMFRLSEALRGLEPENASRLRLALKFSREELILEQMRETHKLLKDAQLSKAETEVRRNSWPSSSTSATCCWPRTWTSSSSWHGCARCARRWASSSGSSRKSGASWAGRASPSSNASAWSGSAARRPDLEALVRDQKSVIADTKDVPQTRRRATAKAARAAIREREVETSASAATALAERPLVRGPAASPTCGTAGHPSSATPWPTWRGPTPTRPSPPRRRRSTCCGEELTRLDEQVGRRRSDLAEAEFRRREGDQAKNRSATESARSEASARLGDVGVALQKGPDPRRRRRCGPPRRAWRKTAAEPAADDQSAALEASPSRARTSPRSVEKLLVELRTELQARLITELTEMHEIQASIRETTQAQAPRVLQKSRTALIAVAGLSKKEAELGERTEQLLALVEETEFGIAPADGASRPLSRDADVEGWLKAGDVSPRTIALEKRIEEDLLGLLQAIRRLPPTTPPPPGSPLALGPARERERELNRLVAELKMIRLLQSRLNDDTVGVDKSRPAPPTLPPALRREVETLEATQEEIRDSLAKIAERLEFPEDNQ